jgi:chromosome segregation ATPase
LAVYRRKAGDTVDEDRAQSQADKLKAEIDQLQSELSSAQSESQQQQQHALQYKMISEALEQQLAQINATYSTFKETTNKEIGENQETIRNLESRCAELEEQLKKTEVEKESEIKEKESLEQKLRGLEAVETQASGGFILLLLLSLHPLFSRHDPDRYFSL